jgi:hypothetical protein
MMDGKSKTEQTQSSTTNPWEPAQPALQGMLSQIQTGLGNTGLTGNETGAINSMVQNAGNASQFAPQITDFAKTLLGGGGATDQAGAVGQNLADYNRRLGATADGANIGANSGLRPYLDTIRDDVTNQVNGSFAAAGRDFSGANMGALGRGVAAGQAPVIAAQYNTDTANMRGAADALYGAGNTKAGILSGLNQTKLGNQAQGVTAAGAANEAQNAGNNAILEAEAKRRGIPVQALGLLAQIGIPIAGLGGQSTGTSQGTQQMSGAQQFGTIMQGFGSIMPKGPISFG